MAPAVSNREARAMASMACVDGPIHGLRLPQHAWVGLRKHGITTLDQLKAMADRLERLERIGPKTAHVVRAELARLVTLSEHVSERQSSTKGSVGGGGSATHHAASPRLGRTRQLPQALPRMKDEMVPE